MKSIAGLIRAFVQDWMPGKTKEKLTPRRQEQTWQKHVTDPSQTFARPGEMVEVLEEDPGTGKGKWVKKPYTRELADKPIKRVTD